MNKFKDEHGHRGDYDQPHWKQGIGRRLRGAVNDEDYDEASDLPKRTSNGKRAGGWGHRYPNISWRKVSRWVKTKVGQDVDAVFSEFLKLAKEGSDERSLEALKEAFHSNFPKNRGEVDVFISAQYGYPYLGLRTEEGHITHLSRKDLYVNSKGIICRIPKSMVNKLENAQIKQRREVFTKKVLWAAGKGFIYLDNQWFEVLVDKVETPAVGWWRAYMNTKCVLCKRLKKNWYNNHTEVFGYDKMVRCVGLRSVSIDLVERYLL